MNQHCFSYPFRQKFCRLSWASGIVSVYFSLLLQAQDLSVLPDHSDGIYQSGEQIVWNVELKGASSSELSYVVKRGGLNVAEQGKLALHDGKAQLGTRSDTPGWLLVEVSGPSAANQPMKALGGALVDPSKIQPARPRPKDFDAFWKAKLKELSLVPMHPRVTPGDSGKPGIDYSQITMDNIRGTLIRGQLARPKEGRKLPAMLIVQWAGVYGLQKNWVTDRAAEGWLVLNISAHDLPIDKPESFYQEQSKGALNDYPGIGNSDRETSYFLRMYLSCYRGAQYLAKRRDWDGRTLVVTGGSQGGLQSFVTAALHPKITAVLANVPAGCDLLGPEAGRLPGWPMWYFKVDGKNDAKVRETASYFDVVNFASRVKCPVLVGVGLIDTVCPSPGIWAACNQLKGPKEIVMLPNGEHGEKKGSHAAYYARFGAWKDALVKGKPAPLSK